MRSIKSILRISSGLALMMLGIIGLVVPFLQGWLLILVAIPLISPEHGKKLALKAREIKDKIKEKWRNK